MADLLERLQGNLQDRYQIERELGRGGMATVYLAADIKHGRKVAIKVLHPELSATIGAERFEREIRLAAKLQHPHILGLYDSGAADGLLYYVMPFVEGESLRDRIDREGQLAVDDAIQIAIETADALGYAHLQGIVHRDIKPENILLSGGHALVADFGIARAMTEGGGPKLTQTGMSMGTPVYMAPEQAVGEVVGPTADIYSLGCVLYEMLAGEPPFTGKNSAAIMARHAMETVPSIRIVRQSVPEEVEEAIFAALGKVPADRPQTTAAFAEILGMPMGSTATRRVTLRHTATRRVPTMANQVYRPDSPSVSWWRRPAFLAAIGVVLVVGVALGAWRLKSGSGTSASSAAVVAQASKVAVLYFKNASSDAQLGPVADGLTEALIGALRQVKGLTIISKNGVAPYKGTDVSVDSIAHVLNVGTLVAGEVDLEGKDKGVRVTTTLLDATGTKISSSHFVVGQDQVLAAQDSLANEVAFHLREALGTEVKLHETQSSTHSLSSWRLLQQAQSQLEAAYKADTTQAPKLLNAADSLLSDAEDSDKKWIDPIVLRGEIADRRGWLVTPTDERLKWYDAGLAHAGRALEKDPGSAKALALRGTLKYDKWLLRASANADAQGALLQSADADLKKAVELDPSLASAYGQLSYIAYDREDVDAARTYAVDAYQADAYLTDANLILSRLFWTNYNTDRLRDAKNWCAEGERRFPDDQAFTTCKLWLMLHLDEKADIAKAWQLAAHADTLGLKDVRMSAAKRGYNIRQVQQLMGGIIGRVAKGATGASKKSLMDSAEAMLKRARVGNKTTDPDNELPGYEAVMRTQMGDLSGAVAMLKKYVADNPEHQFEVAGNLHWWWRPLAGDTLFKSLKTKKR